MKKFLLAVIALVAMSTASAYDFPYLKFTHADGRELVIGTDGLTIAPVDGKLVATNGSETLTLTPAELTKMAFAATNGVGDITAEAAEGPVQVYSLSGCVLKSYTGIEEARADLAPGLYIVKQAGKVVKLAVR
ncbi:MAG: hypothetical protein ACI30N_05230 [Muribaculaceae bacterium]